MTNVERGRDLAAERTRAGVSQTEIAGALGIQRTILSAIENERSPTNAEFNARYMTAVRELAAAKVDAA